MASGEHPSTPSKGNGSFRPLQEQKLVLEKALKVAKSILSPRSGDATHHKPQDEEVTTGSSAGSAVPARNGPVTRSSEQNADLEPEISKLRERISELEKQTGSTGGGCCSGHQRPCKRDLSTICVRALGQEDDERGIQACSREQCESH